MKLYLIPFDFQAIVDYSVEDLASKVFHTFNDLTEDERHGERWKQRMIRNFKKQERERRIEKWLRRQERIEQWHIRQQQRERFQNRKDRKEKWLRKKEKRERWERRHRLVHNSSIDEIIDGTHED